MKKLQIDCPPNTWPKHLTGTVAVGIREPATGIDGTLWLLFQVQEGNVADVAGLEVHNDDIPEDVHAEKPDIVAVTTLQTWSLAQTNAELFAKAAEKGRLHIDGDFRTYGRSFPALLRLVTSTTLWNELDEVLAQLS